MKKESWKCKTCESNYKPYRERISKLYCSLECKEVDLNKKCRYCGKDFKANRLSERLCDLCEKDKKGIARKQYVLRLKFKPCQNCGKLFEGKRQQKLCVDCKNTLPNPLIHKYEWIERPIICLKCGLECGKQKIKNSFKTNSNKHIKICKECKRKNELSRDLKILNEVIRLEKIKAKQRLRKKEAYEKRLIFLHNKSLSDDEKRIKRQIKQQEYYQKKFLQKEIKEFEIDKETLTLIRKVKHDALVKRMKENNPMFRKDVTDKVKKTIHEKIKNGELIYKRGTQHHAYKGNRDFAGECRKWLKKWKRSVLERDNFTCIKCGIYGGEFHIHHIRPLREIMKKVLTENGVSDIVNIKNTDMSLYENLIQKVVDNHTLSDGITVCKQCHADIDDRYRRIKKRIIKDEN